MNVMRFDPWRDMDRLFGELGAYRKGGLEDKRDEGVGFTPIVNTREDDKAYYLEVDLPGVAKEMISLDIKEGVLLIQGERLFRGEIRREDYYRLESGYGKFERSFAIPDDVNLEGILANYLEGVLEIMLPKMGENVQELRHIDIQ